MSYYGAQISGHPGGLGGGLGWKGRTSWLPELAPGSKFSLRCLVRGEGVSFFRKDGQIPDSSRASDPFVDFLGASAPHLLDVGTPASSSLCL
eukprot:5126836-Amphidinium_carterae.1